MMKFEPNLPEDWGYYWVVTREEEPPKLKWLTYSKTYDKDARSVEVWECPGISRRYLDLQNLPKWMWIPIVKPEIK